MSEGQRIQSADAAGQQFMFQTREQRQMQEMDRKAAQLSGAQAQAGQAQADKMGAISAGISAVGSVAGAFAGPKASDRRLKKNITKIGKSKDGLNIYSFEYKDSNPMAGTWQGVMSDEIPKNAVITGDDGYDMVDYSLLDVEFKKI